MSTATLTHAYWDALHRAAMRVIGVLFRPTSQLENQFSSVLIRRGSRRFIATAQHCIASLGDDEPLLLATPSVPRGTPVDWIARNHFPLRDGRDADTAVIEVSRSWADRQDVEWIDADEAGSKHAKTKAQVILLGFPIRSTQRSPGKVIAGAFSVVTEVAPFPRGMKTDSTVIDPRIDVFLQYPTGRFRDQYGAVVHKQNPKGMSGCPVFLTPGLPKTRRVWVPRLRLVAIQSGWFERKGLLRAKRVEYVRNLIASMK